MIADQGYLGSGEVPQVRCCQTTLKSGYSKVATCVSLMFDLPPFWTKMPPFEETLFGQERPSIQRTVSSIWTHISPTMPLPYSMNVRHQRTCGSLSYGRSGAGPVHIS